MSGFVKIYQSILDSSVWSEAQATRLVWITMLAMADQHGCVEASIGGLARRAAVSREEAEAALLVLSSPDPDDKSGVDDGRRIKKIERGWLITNHATYREFRTETQIQTAERVRRHRAKEQSVTRNDVTDGNAEKRQVRAEAEADQIKTAPSGLGAREGAPRPRKTRQERQRRFPDYEPKPEHVDLAMRIGADLAGELEKFRDHEFQHPRSDPDACFRTWLRRSIDFKRAAVGARIAASNGTRAADGLQRQLDRVRALEAEKREAKDARLLLLTEGKAPP